MAGTIDKGITITFKGDTVKFDESVKKINTELNGVKKEVSLLNRELKLDPRNFDKLSQKMDSLKQKEKLLRDEIEAYKKAMEQLDPSSQAFKEAEKKCRELEIQAERTKRQIQEMGGNKIGLGLNVLGESFKDVGGKITDLGESMRGASTVATGVLAGFGALSLKTADYADNINTLSKQTGLSTDTLQVFGQMANLIDVDLNSMAKSAQYVAKNMDTTKAQEAYQKLGVSITDASGQYRSAEDVLMDTLKALQQVPNETERAQIANDVLGKSYSNLGSIINDSTVDIDSLSDTVKENGYILSQDELNALNNVNDSVDTFKMQMAGMGTQLISEFSQPLQDVAGKLTELASKVATFVRSLSTKQKSAILAVITVVAGISPMLIILGSTISAIGTIMTTMGTIVSTITTIWGAFTAMLEAHNVVSVISTGLTTALGGAINFLTSPITLTILAIGALVAIGVTLYKNWDTIKAKASQLWQTFSQTTFIQSLISLFNRLSSAIGGFIGKVQSAVGWLGDLGGKAGDLLKGGFEKLAGLFHSGGFGNIGLYASGGYGSLELNTTINVNNNGANLTSAQARLFGAQIVDYVNENLGRRI